MINLISKEQQLDFDDVLIIPELTTLNSRKDVNLVNNITCIHSNRTITGIPIISANMDKVSTVEAANVLGDYQCFSALHKFVTDEELKNIKHKDKTFLSFGITSMEEIQNKLDAAGVHKDEALICLDVANGGMYKFLHFIEDVREAFPKAFIIAGNCANPDVALMINKAGASLVKVGIGSGSHCKTRTMTGVGYPQMSIVSNCSDLDCLVVSDGGCKTVADIAKAFVVGADMVMVGSMLAGHKENVNISIFTEYSHEWDKPCGSIKVPMRGMSSKAAMIDHYGEMASYRASEGHETMISYRGTIKNTIEEILGGLRSTCTYVNASNISELNGKKLVKIT